MVEKQAKTGSKEGTTMAYTLIRDLYTHKPEAD